MMMPVRLTEALMVCEGGVVVPGDIVPSMPLVTDQVATPVVGLTVTFVTLISSLSTLIVKLVTLTCSLSDLDRERHRRREPMAETTWIELSDSAPPRIPPST